MRLPKYSTKEQLITLIPDTLDDLYILSQFVTTHDIVSGNSHRAYQPPGSSKATRKPVFVELDVEKTDLNEATGSLRILGEIITGKPEEVCPRGAFHALEVDLHESLTIRKEKWSAAQLAELKRIETQSNQPQLLVVLMDDEAADFFVLNSAGFSPRLRIMSDGSGKQFQTSGKEEYFKKILAAIQSFNTKTLLAGPGFYPTDISKYIQQNSIRIEIVIEHNHHTGKTGLMELEKRGATIKALDSFSLALDAQKMDLIVAELGRDSGKIVYGVKEIQAALSRGTVKEIVVLQSLVWSHDLPEVVTILDQSNALKIPVHVMANKTQSAQTLLGLGGMVAILHYSAK